MTKESFKIGANEMEAILIGESIENDPQVVIAIVAKICVLNIKVSHNNCGEA